jgi:hypothetical protein
MLHGGQEQLRRNIKVTVHRGPGNNREGRSIAVRRAKEKLECVSDVMTRRRQQGVLTELSRARVRWKLICTLNVICQPYQAVSTRTGADEHETEEIRSKIGDALQHRLEGR